MTQNHLTKKSSVRSNKQSSTKCFSILGFLLSIRPQECTLRDFTRISRSTLSGGLGHSYFTDKNAQLREMKASGEADMVKVMVDGKFLKAAEQ